eukprot:11407324-Alexandrium_andersonii.AAC.1
MPTRRVSAIPGPCCIEPKGVDALAGGLGAGALVVVSGMPGGGGLAGMPSAMNTGDAGMDACSLG